MPKNNGNPQASEDMPKNEGMQENENAQEAVKPKEPQFGESKVFKKYLRFEQLLTEVTFPRGQTEAQTMKQLGKLFATKTGNQKLILDGIRLVKPDYAITAEDEAQRSERRQISKTARDNMFRFVHQTIDLKFDRNQPVGENYDPNKTVTIPRGINLLYNYNLEDGAEEYNQWIQSLFALDEHNQFINDDINTRTAVMKEFIDRQLGTDFDKLYHMTDREVAENFIQIYSLYVLLMEGGDALKGWNGKAYNLPADYLDKLFKLKATHQGLIGDLKSRFELIANPDYEIFHHERMYINAGGENYNTVGSQEAPMESDYMDQPDESEEEPVERDHVDHPAEFEEAQERYEISKRIDTGKNENAFFDILYTAEFGRYGSGVDKVNQHIRNLGIPEEYLRQIDRSAPGQLTIPLLLDVTDVEGKTVDDFDLTSGVLLTFTDPTNQHKHFLKASSGIIEEIDITRVPDPLKTEPDRLMKMLEAADPWHIRMFTGSKQFNDMKKAMAEVQRLKEELPAEPSSEQQKALHDALDALKASAETYVGYKGDLTRNTKDSERARINAANSILEFVKDGKALLTAYAEGRALAKNEENEKTELQEKIRQHYASNDADDPVAALGREIHDSLRASMEKLPEKPLSVMAKIVAYDLLMRERLADNGGEAGPVEEMYRENAQAFLNNIEQSEALQQAAKGMTVKRFRQFMNDAASADGIEKLAEEILEERVQPVEKVSPPPREAADRELEAKQNRQEKLKKVEQPETVEEFTSDPAIIENEEIALTNDPEVLLDFMGAPENSNLKPVTKEFLSNRIYRLVKMEERAKQPIQNENLPMITEAEEYNEDEEKEIQRKVMLDVKQPRKQTTEKGCWSVSLQLQLNYRGVENIEQEDIRSYRPDRTKQSVEADLGAERLNKNDVNSIANYSTLINQFLPNTVLNSVTFYKLNQTAQDPDRKALLKNVLSKALEEHNSPISCVLGDHYRTIVGIKGDRIYWKDSSSTDSDRTWDRPISDLVGQHKLELYWLQDLKADLGGCVKDMNGHAVEGANYTGGIYSNPSEEITKHNEKFTILEANGQYQAEGCKLTVPSTGKYPVTLSYKRNPAQLTGFAYNMDALGQMSQELKKLSAAGKENGGTGAAYTNLDKLTKKLDGFVNGEYKIDYEQMHRVAGDYQALAGSFGDDKALSRVLGEHLEQVRGALGAHLHYDNRQLGYPARWPEAGSAKREQLEKCLAGLIVEGNIKSVGNENKNWLKYYDTKSINLAKEQIRKGAAFQSMMTKLDERIKQEESSSIPGTERTGARICQKACGGDFGELLTMYAMELNAVPQKAQPASKMQQSLQNQAPELSNPNQGSIGKR